MKFYQKRKIANYSGARLDSRFTMIQTIIESFDAPPMLKSRH